MPIHYYLCSCGLESKHEFSFQEGPADSVKCECGKRAKRLFLVPGVVYRGAGFTKSHIERHKDTKDPFDPKV